MKTAARFLCVIVVFAAARAITAADTGNRAGVPRPGVANALPPVPGRAADRPDDFGSTYDTVLTFHSSAFRPIATSFTYDSTFDELWPTSHGAISGTAFVANLQVPEGAIIDHVYFRFCQDSAVNSGIIAGASLDGGDFEDTTIPAASGCFYALDPVIGQQVTRNTGHLLDLFVNWFNAPVDGSVRLLGAEVWFHRSVSNGPGTSDFGDVATSDPRYKFIEALFQSGITAGCGGGNYCPDAPVTRGQMAVFIAKALGLSWPNFLE